MTKPLIIIFLVAFLTSTLSGQTIVKMAMPEQAEEALSATTLFEEKIPLEVTTYLGPMGYDVSGGFAPYTWKWLKNNDVLSTNDIALITPKAGNTYSAVVVDKNNCSVTLPIEISGEGLKNAGSDGIMVVFSSFPENQLIINLKDAFSQEVAIQLIDIKGVKHFEIWVTGDKTIPLNIASGMYFVHVQGQNIQSVKKIMVP